jgi:hypothetical protein
MRSRRCIASSGKTNSMISQLVGNPELRKASPKPNVLEPELD